MFIDIIVRFFFKGSLPVNSSLLPHPAINQKILVTISVLCANDNSQLDFHIVYPIIVSCIVTVRYYQELRHLSKA